MTKISLIFVCVLFSVFCFSSVSFPLPPNDFEPWRMYVTYENGYDAGKAVLRGTFEKNDKKTESK